MNVFTNRQDRKPVSCPKCGLNSWVHGEWIPETNAVMPDACTNCGHVRKHETPKERA